MENTTGHKHQFQKPFIILLVVGITAICGIVYELLISTAASYLMGDSVRQFSIIIGIFMSSMGFGAYLSKFFENKLIERFIQVEIILSLIGGSSIALIFYFFAAGGILYSIILYGLTVVIGTLVGFEIPLVIRIMENILKLKENVANVLAFDYIGGLIGSLAFPLLLLPAMGILKTSILIGLLNLLSVVWLLINIQDFKLRKIYLGISIACITLLSIAFLYAQPINTYLEQNLFRDKIIFSKQTTYQKLVVTKYKDDIRLFIDGNLQFSSTDEYRYHEGLVHIPVGLTPKLTNVLVLGGGDGLAIRELLKYDSIEQITLVDLDKVMIDIFKSEKLLTELNKNSLNHKKVKTIAADAFIYIQNDTKFYDLIIIDLPDPRTPSLSKLYSKQFYELIKHRLTRTGVMVTQASSPFFSRNAFWCIAETVASVFPYKNQYHLDIMSFGDWGYVLGGQRPIGQSKVQALEIKVPTKYLTNNVARNAFTFAKDISKPANIKINTMLNPVIVQYYIKDWKKW
jgi:spermidine synthase